MNQDDIDRLELARAALIEYEVLLASIGDSPVPHLGTILRIVIGLLEPLRPRAI